MRSKIMKEGAQKAATRCLLNSTGLSNNEIGKPWIAVVNSYTEIVPGHIHLNTLVKAVKEGIWQAGGVPFEFNTIAVCDGIAQGTQGMKYSLPSRDLIVDTIEIMVEGHGFDAMVLVPSCDKTVPAHLMAAARLNIPSIVLTGGSMLSGRYKGDELSLVEMREYIGQYKKGEITEKELAKIETLACPTAGSCSMIGTANTMAALTEALGMSLPGCATIPAVYAEKVRLARKTGQVIMTLLEKEVLAKEIMTYDALQNAISVNMAIGGSLNAVLHLTALAQELGIEKFNLDLFDKISKVTPLLCSLKPSGEFSFLDLHNVGGIQAVMAELLRHKLLLPTPKTVTGNTQGELLETVPNLEKNSIIKSVDNPVHPSGGITILYGNLAPQGAVIKQSAVSSDMLKHQGFAKVFDKKLRRPFDVK